MPDIPLRAFPSPDGAGLLHLSGQARGAVLGLGPEIGIRIWLRADGWLRADLRYESEDVGLRHDVLIWSSNTCLLLDRRRGRLTEMGANPGECELAGGIFTLEHFLWIALGKSSNSSEELWSSSGDEWRRQLGDVGMRGRSAEDGRSMEFMEILWRDQESHVHQLQSFPEETIPTSWGWIPSSLTLDGSDLEGRLRIEWTPTILPDPGEQIFDPLWEPSR